MAILIDDTLLHCPNPDCKSVEFEKVTVKAFNVGSKHKEYSKPMLLEVSNKVLLKCIKCGTTIDTKEYDLRDLK